MFRRLCSAQVPIEMARSVVAIADTGSFSKAGHALGLSQPAISSHVKRVQTIVGGPIFEKNNLGGMIFTPRGQSALALMRKLLDVNDQIASIGGADSGRQFLRIGVSVEYAPSLLQALSQTKRDVSVQVYANTSAEVAKGLNDGFLDVGCLYGDHLTLDHVIDEWDEAFAWARHPQFVTSPGEPIPLVCWPGSGSDGCVERCLEREGLAYRVAFASPDHLVRREAVTARVGVAGMLRRFIDEPLIVASDYYLPKLPALRGKLAFRADLSRSLVDRVRPLLLELCPHEAARVGR